MRKNLYCLFIVVLVSSISFSQLKLNLPADIDMGDKNPAYVLNFKSTETTSGSYSPAELPADATSFIPGTIILGLLGDVTFPFGEEFKNYAGTGWSVHGFGGYSILNSIIFGAKIGYIKFGEVETDFNAFEKTSQITEGIAQTNSQLIIALMLQYLLGGGSCIGPLAGGTLKPFIAISLCLILKSYTLRYLGLAGFSKTGNISQSNDEYKENSTIFGISPAVGTYFNVSENFSLVLSADYYYLFDKADEEISGSANINYLSLTFGGAYSIR